VEQNTEKQEKNIERRGGFLLFLGVPVLLLLYIFTPQQPMQFVCLFLIVLILGAKAYSEYLARHLRLVRCDRELRVFRHEWTKVEVWVENHGLLPAFLLVINDTTGMVAVFRNEKCLCTLGPKRRQLFRWEAFGSARGVYLMGPAVLRGADPLGLFPFHLDCGERTKLYVYPSPAFVNLKSPGGIPLGNLLTGDPFNEDLTRYRSLREYRSGDESKRINWKASARTSTLLVNEYELSLSYPLVLFLNVDVKEYGIRNRESYIERMIEVATAVCLMAARDRQVLGLILHTSDHNNADDSLISPAAFTMIPVLEKLASLEPFKIISTPINTINTINTIDPQTETSSPKAEQSSLRSSTRLLLEKGKTLSFGTRLIYAGPALPEEDYYALETLKRQRLSIEYFVIDEKTQSFVYGTHRYQVKERGYELL